MINVDLWKKINKMLQSSDRKIELFQCDEVRGINIIKEIGLNNTTTLSTIIANCAGVIVDDCIRILGQGDVNVHGIYEVNLIENGSANRVMGMLLVAFDIFGGLFAMNMGAINDEIGVIYYFAPDTLEWESIEMNYSEFLQWCVLGNISKFYQSFKWNDWRQMAKEVKFNDEILIYPFLWSKEHNINTAEKKIVSFNELFNLNMDYRKKFFE